MKNSLNDKNSFLSPFSDLDENNYSSVDMIYNIGRIEGKNFRGFDAIDLITNDRVYITKDSNLQIENDIRQKIGSKAVLELKEQNGAYGIYKVPLGARLLTRTLEISPYNIDYMNMLRTRASEFLRKLNSLDEHAFGITIEHLAIAHNGLDDGPDDTYLTVVPPIGRVI